MIFYMGLADSLCGGTCLTDATQTRSVEGSMPFGIRSMNCSAVLKAIAVS